MSFSPAGMWMIPKLRMPMECGGASSTFPPASSSHAEQIRLTIGIDCVPRPLGTPNSRSWSWPAGFSSTLMTSRTGSFWPIVTPAPERPCPTCAARALRNPSGSRGGPFRLSWRLTFDPRLKIPCALGSSASIASCSALGSGRIRAFRVALSLNWPLANQWRPSIESAAGWPPQ